MNRPSELSTGLPSISIIDRDTVASWTCFAAVVIVSPGSLDRRRPAEFLAAQRYRLSWPRRQQYETVHPDVVLVAPCHGRCVSLDESFSTECTAVDRTVRWARARSLYSGRQRKLESRRRRRPGRLGLGLPRHETAIRRLRDQSRVLGRHACQQRNLHPLRRPAEDWRGHLLR